jgi:epoxyqueuosine reductase
MGVDTGAKQAIREKAAGLGIDGLGFTDAGVMRDTRTAIEQASVSGSIPPEEVPRPGTLARLTDPRRHLKSARTVISAYLRYSAEPTRAAPGEGVIAPYTRFDHYGELKARLRTLAAFIRERYGRRTKFFSCYVALAEKPLARKAGIGFYGKNGVIITPEHGSFVVLGELLTSLELPSDRPLEMDCGDCRRCLDACPTGAIRVPGVIDRRRCIQYVSERPGEVPDDMVRVWGDRIYGCATCQEVCPFNRDLSPVKGTYTRGRVEATIPLATLINMGGARFRRLFDGNQIGMREPDAIRRNAIIAAGSSRMRDLAVELEQAAGDPDPAIRGHAALALARLLGAEARPALRRIARREQDGRLRQELKSLLDGPPDVT